MFTDLANFSCNSKNKGIVSSLAHILEAQRKIFECVEAEGGRVIKTMGDSLIALFSCPDKALAISIQIMRSDLFQDTLTIGLGFGKLIKVGERDIFGEEVNNSSFLAEDFGKAGQLLISKAFKDSLNDINPIVFVELATTKPDIAAFEVSWG
jgi:class 3 adenylate cyclase